MAEETPEVVKSQDELIAEMKAATESGDWKAVSRLSSQIAKMVAAEEKAEKEEKLKAIAGLTEKVKGVLDKAVNRLVESGELDGCDGVWYSYDFGEKLTTCRLLKGQARKGGGGGGGGKKFNISTEELLNQYGDQIVKIGDVEQTFKEHWDSTPATDGNARYKIRVKLLKVAKLT
jgi:hypothetical protein